MGPKLEDQLSDLTTLVGQFITATGAAIEKTNKKVEELTDAVDTLTDQLKDEATRQTTSSARVDKQVRQTADAIDKLASSKTGGKATKATVSLLRPQDPPELTTTRMGTNHYDWLQQSLAAIRFWNPDAARLLTDKSLSITDDGVFYLDPAHCAATSMRPCMLCSTRPSRVKPAPTSTSACEHMPMTTTFRANPTGSPTTALTTTATAALP